MSKIVGYLYRDTRYTPLGMKEWLIREGLIPREAFEPRAEAFGTPLPEPGIDTVIDAYAPKDPQVFMDQPETYSSDDWPKFVFDDEVPEWSLAYFVGAPDVVREWEAKAQTLAEEEFGAIAERQGWNQDSRESVLMSFIRERGLMPGLSIYARDTAYVENEGSRS